MKDQPTRRVSLVLAQLEFLFAPFSFFPLSTAFRLDACWNLNCRDVQSLEFYVVVLRCEEQRL